ncbi:MAG: hypothetical protein JO032_21810 [Alphaproteobacteria bacterium]|nr:hypothetical protein [Alphaproteobacteria bacterium]
MDLKQAVAIAKREVSGLYDARAAHELRLEHFLYDDHLGVWSLTIGFALPGAARGSKIVRVSQADQSVLSVRDP